MRIDIPVNPSLEFDVLRARMRLMAENDHRPVQVRRAMMAQAAAATPLPAGVTAHDVLLGGVPGVRFSAGPSKRTVLYIHGGAFQLGSPTTHRVFASAICLQAQTTVFSVDYRLAPEAPFPAAVDDCLVSYESLVSNLNGAAALAVVGDSAGGALAMSMLASALTAGLPAPTSLTVLSPWADLRCSNPSYEELAAVDPLMRRESLLAAARDYLNGHPATDPRASPVFADFRGFPPTLLQVAANEILLDDAIHLEAALERAGIKARLEVWQHMAHAFQMFPHAVPEAKMAVAEIALFIDAHFQDTLTSGG
jgi:epsilon-lactone hydrolase